MVFFLYLIIVFLIFNTVRWFFSFFQEREREGVFHETIVGKLGLKGPSFSGNRFSFQFSIFGSVENYWVGADFVNGTEKMSRLGLLRNLNQLKPGTDSKKKLH